MFCVLKVYLYIGYLYMGGVIFFLRNNVIRGDYGFGLIYKYFFSLWCFWNVGFIVFSFEEL